MGIEPKYNEKNPPPFHVNVNNSPYNEMNNNYNNYTNKNKPTSSVNNATNNRKSVSPTTNQNYNQPNTYMINQNSGDSFSFDKIYNEQGKKSKKKWSKSKKKEKNTIDEENDFAIDIDVINKNKVNVKIPVNKNKLWQKEYDNNELIGTIINDYISENRLNIPNDFFNELRCFNNKVNMEDKISTLLPIGDESNDVYQGSDINSKNIDLSHLNEKYTEIIGKPFYGPFEILCFYKSQRKFKILFYNNELITKTEINKFNMSSAYCNGWNHLYISGGELCPNKFWDINLKKNLIHSPVEMPPKKKHSIIYIPKSIVFIVGGDSNTDTFYYNLKLKKLVIWGNLNMIRIEPALQIVKNKLYCINDFYDIHNYSLEVTDLTSNEGKWKLIKPKLSYNLTNSSSYQKMFGICKDKDDNIIFLGGDLNNINNGNNNNMNLMLNTINNTLGISQVKYIYFKLKEKAFCPFNKLYDFVLTDFKRDSPQMAFYNKKKGKIELINFSPDDISKKTEVGKGSMTNAQSKINNKKNSDKISTISPLPNINYINNQNLNNKHNVKNGMFISLLPEDKSSKASIYPPSLNNQNNKLINNTTPIYDYKYNSVNNNSNLSKTHFTNNIYTNNNNLNAINSVNYQNNYIRKETPHFLNNNINKYSIRTNQNYILNDQTTLLNNRNTVDVYSKTPDKYYNNYQTVIVPNSRRNTYYNVQRDSSHSADAAKRRLYYPRDLINRNIYRVNKYY